MGFSEFIGEVVLILLASSFVRPFMADPRANVVGFGCNSSRAVNSTILAHNAILVLSNQTTLIGENGFGTTAAGEGPNAVFGLTQCYKDLSSADCMLCFIEIRNTLPRCGPSVGGRLFLDGCFSRYENFSFFDQGVDSINFKNCSSSKNHSQPEKFNEVLRKVIGSVSLASKRIKGFAVASDSISKLTIYALAQCWESLDEKTCNSCLQAAASSIISCSPSVEGRSLIAGCYMRYSTELFRNLNQTTTHSPGTSKSLWIILGLALVGFLALTMIGFWEAEGYLGTSNRKSSKDSYGSGLSIPSKLNFRYKELRRATNNFDSSNKLGQGSYGSVYKGVLPDGREFAVKRLFLNTGQWIDQFFNEVNLINQVQHKNLVKLLGCSVDGPESLLVYKYYFNKSLDHFLFDENQARLLDWQKRIDIIQGVAEGLVYLHEESEIRIIHRDIKASNILLDDKFKPKITDFGLARSFTVDQTHLSTGIAGTLGYMAPEYVVHGHLTEKADIYSFGVLILEIITGQRCNNGLGAKPGQIFLAKIWSHYKDKTINKLIDRSFYEDAMEDDILHVVHVGLLCTQATPHHRPTMAKVVELLRSGRDQKDVFPTEPPFLDVLAMEILEDGNQSSLVRQNGFGTAAAGEGPNAVFGLAQCYKDLNSSDCMLCYSQMRNTIPKCSPHIGGRVFLDGCFSRYENFSFFSQGIDSVNLKNCSSSENNSQPDSFNALLRKVIGSVSLASQRIRGFAEASDSISNLTVYALAQSWESLNENTCNSCLQAAASSIMFCSPSVEGWALIAGCYMRYSTECFWNLNQTTTNSSGAPKALWIILGSALGGFLVLSGIAFWKAKGCLGRSYCKSSKVLYGSGLSGFIDHSKLNFRYKDLRRATNNFDSSNKLGQGGYGSVYKGVLPVGRDVAVKRSFLNTCQWVDQFLNEVNLINQVRHKSLVKLLGCSVDGPESLLVYNFYFNKSLDHFIFDENQAKLLDWQKRIDIIQGVAEGFAYFHKDSEIQIIHRDIKASNILLDDKFKPKITDFGLARSFMEDQTHLSTGIAGTLGHMAPEYVVHRHLTEKADVYSFGVLILEIVSGQRCNNGPGAKPGQIFLATIWSHYEAKTIKNIIDRSFYDGAVEDEIVHVVQVGLLCTQGTASYCPTMGRVVELLRNCREQEDVFPTEPPFLDILPVEIQEEGEGSHLLSPPSFSGSSGNLLRV